MNTTIILYNIIVVKTVRAFKYRIFPSKSQCTTLEKTLGICCEIYNAALEERIGAWKHHHSVSCYSQINQLPEVKEQRTDVGCIYSQVLQDVLKRLDRAFSGFFRRIKTHQKAGFPRFRSRKRYKSFTYPQSGFRLVDNHTLRLSKVGDVHIKLHRPIAGKIKSLTIKRENDKWFAVFAAEDQIVPFLKSTGETLAVDMGVEHLATDQHGNHVQNPCWFSKSQRRLARLSRKHSKRRSCKTKKSLRRAHEKVANQRRDFYHKLSRDWTSKYKTIILEDLSIQRMMSKSVGDAGWGQFIQMLKYKAAEAGTLVVEVNPAGTSQTCPVCGIVKSKTLSQRQHVCDCGCKMHRDHAAARVILARGLACLGSSPRCPVV